MAQPQEIPLAPNQITPELAAVMARCPYRSVISIGGPTLESKPPIREVVAVLGSVPTPIAPERMAELVKAINNGESVLLLSDKAELRDYAKREILAMVNPIQANA